MGGIRPHGQVVLTGSANKLAGSANEWPVKNARMGSNGSKPGDENSAKFRRFPQAPRSLRARSRRSSRAILCFKVLNGMPRYRAVAVTFQSDFSSARRMKLRSNVSQASWNRVSLVDADESSFAKWYS